MRTLIWKPACHENSTCKLLLFVASQHRLCDPAGSRRHRQRPTGRDERKALILSVWVYLDFAELQASKREIREIKCNVHPASTFPSSATGHDHVVKAECWGRETRMS